MQALQEPRRDDFDMAKLQKTLKQQQQRSLRARSLVTKLTPAEIRSLNNSIAAANSANSSSPGNSQKTGTNTPPLTPDNVLSSQQQQQPTPTRNSISLPTPPQSPEDKYAPGQNGTIGNGTHIYSPIPQSHNKAGLFLGNNSSRPASASSHRAIPTYRGPEMTKTGSISMLHQSALTHQIVDNPLSQFSRPRQPRGSVSPTRQEQKQRTPSMQSETRSLRSQSVHVVENETSRNVEALKKIEAPERAMSPIPITKSQDPAEAESRQINPMRQRAQTVAVAQPIPINSSSRFAWNWRRKFSTHRGDNSENPDLKKTRRRTLSGSRAADDKVQSVAYETTKAGVAPAERASLKGDLPSSKTSIYSENEEEPPASTTGFETHPAVRPLSAQSERSTESKGKGREMISQEDENSHDVLSDESVPMYSRCSCCGKLKKSNGNRSLSPVLENENLKTNFSLEMERSDKMNLGRKRSNSSTNRSKYTPIIPMMIAEGTTVQAKIAPNRQDPTQKPPEPELVVNERGDIIAPGTEPIALIPKQLEEKDRTIVRFSSLRPIAHEAKSSKNTIPARRDASKSGAANKENPVMASVMNGAAHSDYSAPPSDFTDHTRTFRANQDFKYDNSHGIISKEVTGELMAAMNGVDMFFDTSPSHYAKPTHERPLDNSNNSSIVTHGNENQSSAALHNLPSTNDATVQTPQANNLLKPRTRSVSFDPAIVEQQRMARSNVAGPMSQKPRVSRNHNVNYQNGSSAQRYPATSAHGITTRPKATAQFMHQNSDDAQPLSLRNGETTNKVSDGGSTEPNSKTLTPVDNDDDVTIGENKIKPYTPLPIPQLGNDFGQTNGNWSKYDLPPTSKHSNLVESVLAATNKRYDFQGEANRS